MEGKGCGKSGGGKGRRVGKWAVGEREGNRDGKAVGN
jgi:hypothetical protein